MHLFRGLHTIPSDFTGCAATIGNFDGVHLGHQEILAALKQRAEELSQPSLVIIFEPQPKEFFAPAEAPARLTNLREKLQAIAAFDIDYVLCLPFNQRLRGTTGAAFISEILHQALAVKYLLVGDDFRFGCDRSGDYQALLAGGEEYGFEVCDTPTHELDGERVSSTRVRSELAANNLPRVQRMLQRPYRMTGRVAHGRKLGRTLNTPTANLLVKRHRLPMTGVYCVHVWHQQGGKEYTGVANIGVKPSIDGSAQPSLEVHLFEFQGDLYGQHLTVEFLHKIRDEKKFASIDELKSAIEDDKQAAQHYLAARPNTLRFE